MTTLDEGDLVAVPCEVGPGPFAHERTINVPTMGGPLLGFANEADLTQDDDREHGFLTARVLAVSDDAVTVRLFGHFFRTTLGWARVRRDALMALGAK